MNTILWDFDIQTDQLISARQTGLKIINTKKRKKEKKNRKEKREPVDM